MANIGDDAIAAGLPLVPGSGEEGKRKYGAREINKTRDFIAQFARLIPKSKGAYRTATGITSGTNNPSGGENGDIHFKVI
ncbi:hypothetical protein GORDON_29 [Arthrobacter phage Gordon]|uniref:Uncharacterized protein n=1 Tax=Arthrobacter phage Gordon TaxID=1772298 RepID=A0A0U4JZC0_9CAUD|nr:hypothetical protein FDH69_gp29 [Arthrobacter phage Gordon]ALY09004.1 hypothetical protein GORDON_29 [Arthrobacter phage Gordon]